MCCGVHSSKVITNSSMVDTIPNTHLVSTPAITGTVLIQSEPRHVHFQEHVTIMPSNVTDPESDSYNSWYEMNELAAFRNDAREICREMRYQNKVESDTDSSSDSEMSSPPLRLPSMAKNSLTRGLEQRSCDERQRRKYLANRFILKVYRTQPNKVAQVCWKVNAWATELAIEEAAMDYKRVYGKSDRKRLTYEPTVESGAKRIRIRIQ